MADHAGAGGTPGGTTSFGLRIAHSRPRLVDLASRLEVIAHRIRTVGLVRAAEDLASVGAELRRFAQAQIDETEPS